MSKKMLQFIALLMAAMILLAACGGDDDGDSETGGGGEETTEDASSPEDEGDDAGGDTVSYTAVDYGFQGPETLPAGEVTLELENEGKEPHMMAFVQLLQGKTIDDVNAFIEKNGLTGKPPSWAKNVKGGIGGVKPGETKTGKVEVEAGSYVAMCFIPSKKNDGKAHAELGMVYPITVEG
jgi:hypothetical protein